MEIVVHNFVGVQAENCNVLRANQLRNLHICAVQGAQGHSAVEHKLHVAGAAGLLARCGNLLGDIRCRVDELGRGNVEVLQEYHLDLLADHGIGVDQIRNGADILDSLLGKGIARRRLARK